MSKIFIILKNSHCKISSMKNWYNMIFCSFFLCIISSWIGVSESISSSEISLTDLRSELDTMLTKALKTHTYVPSSGIGNREELILNDVVREVDMFGDFSNVRRWYSLSSLDTVYLLGLTEQPGLEVIVLDQNKTNVKNNNSHAISISKSSTNLPYKVLNAAIFQWWNRTSREMETICVVAIDNPEKDLKWYRFADRKLDEFWSWPIHKTVNDLQIFTDERFVKLVLANDAPSNTIAMYDINLDLKPDFSLSQIIHFETSVLTVAISFVGESIFMSVPQTEINVISVFKLDTPTMLHSQFHSHENLTCKGVRDVKAFKTAYQSYLAVVGDVTTLYLFKFNGDIVKDLKINLGTVAKWAPIKLATYRDDILLMARRNDDNDIYFLGWRGSDKGFSQLIGSDSFCSGSHTKGAWQELCNISKLGWEGATSFLLDGIDSAVAFFLIPNTDGSSSLFRLTTSFNPVQSPIIWELNVLKERKNFIQELLEEQKEKIARLEKKLKNTLRDNSTNVVTGSWKINQISTSCLDRGEHFSVREDETDATTNLKKSEEISFQKLKQIVDNFEKAGESVMNDQLMKDNILKYGKVTNRVSAKNITIIESANIETTLNGMSIANLLNGTYRIDRPRKVMGPTSVDNLRADNLKVLKISNIDTEDFIYAGDVLEINNNILFSNDVHVDNVIMPDNGKVNGIDFSRDIFQLDDHYKGTLHFEDLGTGSLVTDNSKGDDLKERPRTEQNSWESVISGNNLTVYKVNGRLWNEIIDSAIWTNKNQTITGALYVEGKITVKGNMLIENDETTFNGKKVNDHDGTDVPEKSIKGDFNKSTYKGSRCINRKNLLSMKIKSVKNMKGNVIFSGNVFVDGLLRTTNKNSQQWSDQVKSLILKTDPKPVINASKNFHQLTVKGDLKAEKNISGYNLNNFMTLDSEQEIPGSKTFGEHVAFENIVLNGTWDGINITDLYRNSIHLSSNQSLPDLHLIMDKELPDNDSGTRIMTPTLTVRSENKKPKTKISPRSDIDESDNNIPFFDVEKISFKEIEVMGSLFVEKRVAGQNFTDFMRRRVSLREKDNIITGNYSFKRIDADNLAGKSINGQPISKLEEKSIITDVGVGSMDVLDIEELHVDGNIKTRNGVLGFDISKLSQTAFFLNIKNCTFNGTLQFQEEVSFEKLIVEGLISGINFTEFLHDSVRFNENVTKILGKKVFGKGLNVEGTLDLTNWNGLKLTDALTKNTNQSLISKLFLKKVNFSDKTHPEYLKIDGFLNGMNFSKLSHNLKYSANAASQWDGDISFENDITIDNITIQGHVIGTNIKEFVENVYIIGKNALLSSVIFEYDISVLGDLFVTGDYNDVNVEEYKRNMVFTTEVSNVKGNVSFTGKVVVNKDLRVFNNLESKTLYGCDFEEWKSNAIYINEFHGNHLPIPGKKLFRKVTVSGNLKTDLTDNIDFKNAILLNDHQTIQETLKFSKVIVTNNVEVGQSVNGLHLPEEYERTLMVDGDQVVSSSCNFIGEFVILKNLETIKSVNGKLIQNTATLDDNQTLHDNFTFKCIIAKNEIATNDSTISEINIEDWHRRVILKDTEQSVLRNWDVGGNVTFEKPLKGSGVFNGINITRVSNKLDLCRKEQIHLHSEMNVNLTIECSDVSELVNKSRQQVFKLQHFETLQKILFDSRISSVHHFETRTGSFLVVSFSTNCRIFVYKWSQFTRSFNKIYEQPFKGPVEEWSTLRLGGKTFLIAQTKDSLESNVTCSSNGLASLWGFQDPFGQFYFVRELNDYYGKIIGTDEKSAHLYTYNDGIVSKWIYESSASIDSPPKLMDTMTKEEIGFSRADGSFMFEVKFLSKLVGANGSGLKIRFWNEPAIQNEFSLHPQGKFLAISTSDLPEIGNSDFVSIYRQNGSLFERIPALQPVALTWIQFSQHTLLAFLEGNSTLKIYVLSQDSGEGFVRLLSTNLKSRNLQSMLLPLHNRSNKLPALLTYTENEINFIIGNLAGSMYEGALPDCSTDGPFR